MILLDENVIESQRQLLRSWRIRVQQLGQGVVSFVRRVLHHPALDTQAKRLGKVIRVSHAGLMIWSVGSRQETELAWPS